MKVIVLTKIIELENIHHLEIHILETDQGHLKGQEIEDQGQDLKIDIVIIGHGQNLQGLVLETDIEDQGQILETNSKSPGHHLEKNTEGHVQEIDIEKCQGRETVIQVHLVH
jgi:short-subunit dehydrogenase